MADYGISTLGTLLGYSISATTPSSFTLLHRINSIPEVTVSTESIDASALEDEVSHNIKGRGTVSDTFDIVVNRTNETEKEWNDLITAYNAKTSAQKLYIEIYSKGLDKANLLIVQPPSMLPSSAQDQNSLQTMTISCIVESLEAPIAKIKPTDATVSA